MKPTSPPDQAPASVESRRIEGMVLDPKELIVDADAQPVVGDAPLIVHLRAELADDASTSTTFTWTFDDGTAPAQGANLFHVYKQPGTYTASVTVTDTNGNRGTDDVEIVVSKPANKSQPRAR